MALDALYFDEIISYGKIKRLGFFAQEVGKMPKLADRNV
jgi:hypothetical protein